MTNAIKCAVAEKLVARGVPLHVLTSSALIGSEAASARFDQSYDEYRRRVRRVFGA